MISATAITIVAISTLPTNNVWGDDIICSPSPPPIGICVGTPRNDNILGLSSRDLILGFSGNDNLLGKDGADFMAGGTGTDKVLGGEGDDLLNHGECGTATELGCLVRLAREPDGSKDFLDCGPGTDSAVINTSVDHDRVQNYERVIAG